MQHAGHRDDYKHATKYFRAMTYITRLIDIGSSRDLMAIWGVLKFCTVSAFDGKPHKSASGLQTSDPMSDCVNCGHAATHVEGVQFHTASSKQHVCACTTSF